MGPGDEQKTKENDLASRDGYRAEALAICLMTDLMAQTKSGPCQCTMNEGCYCIE